MQCFFKAKILEKSKVLAKFFNMTFFATNVQMWLVPSQSALLAAELKLMPFVHFNTHIKEHAMFYLDALKSKSVVLQIQQLLMLSLLMTQQGDLAHKSSSFRIIYGREETVGFFSVFCATFSCFFQPILLSLVSTNIMGVTKPPILCSSPFLHSLFACFTLTAFMISKINKTTFCFRSYYY